MTYYEIVFLTIACAGDFSVAGLKFRPVPQHARPLAAVLRADAAPPLCRLVPQSERVGHRAEAERRLRELGPAAHPRLRWCRQMRCWERRVSWKSALEVR